MACPNCGSWAVRADRSLAGRMVCGRCGEPLGIGQKRHLRAVSGMGRWRRSGRQRFWLGLAALLLVSAVLAAVAERQPARPRREGSGGLTLRQPAAGPGSGMAGLVGIR